MPLFSHHFSGMAGISAFIAILQAKSIAECIANRNALAYNNLGERSAEMYESFEFDLDQASFEWDEEKERINFIKHGIHFKTAARVFLDPNKLIREDIEHPE